MRPHWAMCPHWAPYPIYCFEILQYIYYMQLYPYWGWAFLISVFHARVSCRNTCNCSHLVHHIIPNTFLPPGLRKCFLSHLWWVFHILWHHSHSLEWSGWMSFDVSSDRLVQWFSTFFEVMAYFRYLQITMAHYFGFRTIYNFQN